MSKRTITGTIGCWVTEFSSIGPQDLVTGDGAKIIHELQYSNVDMAPEWTRVGDATISVLIDNPTDIVNARIDCLRVRQTKLRADAERDATTIERQIQSLLAITNEVQP